MLDEEGDYRKLKTFSTIDLQQRKAAFTQAETIEEGG
jgi:hypothetical protein